MGGLMSDENGLGDDQSVQEAIEQGMPEFPEDRRDTNEDKDVRMTTDEHEQIHNLFDGLVHTLYDRGYTPSELGVVINGIGHRMNAARYHPHEYDRIALTLDVRQAVEQWREEQDDEIPPLVIAETIEELGRHYRHIARREVYSDDDDEDGGDSNE